MRVPLVLAAEIVIVYFTPCNQKRLDQGDLDLGSAGVVLIPGTSLLFGGKQGGIADATGIGWYAADATAASLAVDAGKLVLKNQLKQVGTARFKTGDPAVLHEFVGVAGCPAGAASMDKLFKPYMQFENAPNAVFRNWDRSDNYRITRDAPQFDRSGQVLAP